MLKVQSKVEMYMTMWTSSWCMSCLWEYIDGVRYNSSQTISPYLFSNFPFLSKLPLNNHFISPNQVPKTGKNVRLRYRVGIWK